MKRLIVLAVALALISGCCTATVNGVTTKSPLNCVKPAVNIVDKKVCPTLATAKDAVAAAGFLQGYPGLYAAWLVFDNFSKGVCYMASQLNQALADYDAAPVPVGMAKVMLVKPPLTDFRAAVK